jgi:hypothetical protein
MKTARQVSAALLILLLLAAAYIGVHMIADPTGQSLGLPFYLLNGTVFSDYYLTGWILLGTISLPSLITVICIFLRLTMYSFLILLEGVLICILVIAQMILLGDVFPVQLFFLVAGILLVALGVLQQQRKIVVESEKHFQPAQKSHHHKHRKK